MLQPSAGASGRPLWARRAHRNSRSPAGPRWTDGAGWWLFWWLLGTQLVGVAPVPDGRNGKDLQPRVAFEEDAQVSDSQAVSR